MYNIKDDYSLEIDGQKIILTKQKKLQFSQRKQYEY